MADLTMQFLINSIFWHGFRASFLTLLSVRRISGTIMWIPSQDPILAPKYLKTSSGSIFGIWISWSLALGSLTNQVSFLVTTWNVWLFSPEMVIPRLFMYLWSISTWRCTFLSSLSSRTMLSMIRIQTFLLRLTFILLIRCFVIL